MKEGVKCNWKKWRRWGEEIEAKCEEENQYPADEERKWRLINEEK